MDPLTHSLVGASLARTRLGRGMPLAGAACLIGANLPDVDVLSYFGGVDAGFDHRRGWTHGLLALAIQPVVVVALLLLWDRWRQGRSEAARPLPDVRRLAWLSLIAVWSHPALDWLNTYGVRLLMPFDGRWFYGDTLFIIDPWIWLVLLAGLFLGRDCRSAPWGLTVVGLLMAATVTLADGAVPGVARTGWLVGLAATIVVGHRRAASGSSGRWAEVGLALTVVWALTLGIVSWTNAHWVRGELARRGIDRVEGLMVGPLPANPFVWDVLAETGCEFHHGRMSWLGGYRLDLVAETIPKPTDTPAVRAARSAPCIAGAMNWMRFPFVEVDDTQRGKRVVFLDARYLRRRTNGFGSAAVELDGNLEVSGCP